MLKHSNYKNENPNDETHHKNNGLLNLNLQSNSFADNLSFAPYYSPERLLSPYSTSNSHITVDQEASALRYQSDEITGNYANFYQKGQNQNNFVIQSDIRNNDSYSLSTANFDTYDMSSANHANYSKENMNSTTHLALNTNILVTQNNEVRESTSELEKSQNNSQKPKTENPLNLSSIVATARLFSQQIHAKEDLKPLSSIKITSIEQELNLTPTQRKLASLKKSLQHLDIMGNKKNKTGCLKQPPKQNKKTSVPIKK